MILHVSIRLNNSDCERCLMRVSRIGYCWRILMTSCIDPVGCEHISIGFAIVSEWAVWGALMCKSICRV